ncbi:hypothetical protein [Sphingomonas oryzagri]|jgi:hypothetical protein|uniref:Secreted protein n=1 Tax=Sphingomonas oryzagri TaxID=3042314 RepID=A0ABT6N3R1_9SPHN|nr:hypothetical protein [Sphingomonas oryzagri]MDH7639940.1 hypothetical protein [Sphingomonas oryzagri]
MRSFVIAGAACLLTVSAATAQVASTGNGRATADIGKGSSDPNKVVCITEEVTGSRLGAVKTCHTNAEWAQYQREMRNTVDRMSAGKNYQLGQGGGPTFIAGGH